MSLREIFRDIVSITAGLVAILTVLLGFAIWATSYVTTRHEYRTLSCRNEANIELMSTLVVNNNLYAKYVNSKVNINAAGPSEKVRLEETKKRLWQQLQASSKRASRLRDGFEKKVRNCIGTEEPR